MHCTSSGRPVGPLRDHPWGRALFEGTAGPESADGKSAREKCIVDWAEATVQDMGVIDVDPILLERSATAALHAAKQADRHMEAEIVGDVDALIETLTPIGPYAYAIKPEIHADGGVHIPIETTREGIH